VTSSDPNYPKTPILTFCIAFHIFIVSGDRDYKFGRYRLTVASATPLMINHPSERGVVKSRKPFKFWWAPTISLKRLIV